MMRYSVVLALLLVLLLASAAGAVSSLVRLGPDGGFERELELEAGVIYEIQMSMQAVTGPGQVILRAESFDAAGNVIEFRQTERGLVSPTDWQVVSVQIPVPEQAVSTQMVVRASHAGEYRWRELEIRRVRTSSDEVRQFWEDKLAVYPTVYTGLVIDARHLPAGRSMSPRILTESGQLVYGGVFASMEFVQETGVVAYGPELAPPVSERVAAHPTYPLMLPLIVEAVDVADPAGTHLVIADDDAKRIFAALAAYDFLARYAVVILVD